jgi:hypothetical protein
MVPNVAFNRPILSASSGHLFGLPPHRSAGEFLSTRLRVQGELMSVWTVLFVVLLIAWIGGFTVFHVAGGLIHLLLVFAVISLILHFVLGNRSA